MKKKPMIIAGIAVAICIVIIAIVTIVMIGNSSAKKVAEQLERADRYLSELDYESAIAAYEAVLDIDPKSEEAYLGLAEAYIAIGDYKEALEILEEGFDRTDSEDIEEMLEEVEELIEHSEDMSGQSGPVPENETTPVQMKIREKYIICRNSLQFYRMIRLLTGEMKIWKKLCVKKQELQIGILHMAM